MGWLFKYRGKSRNKASLIVLKAFISLYVFFLSTSYLTSNTNSFFHYYHSVDGEVTIGAWDSRKTNENSVKEKMSGIVKTNCSEESSEELPINGNTEEKKLLQEGEKC